MKIVVLALTVLLQAAAVVPAFACGCELICPEGEVYSDDAEMCVPVSNPTS